MGRIEILMVGYLNFNFGIIISGLMVFLLLNFHCNVSVKLS